MELAGVFSEVLVDLRDIVSPMDKVNGLTVTSREKSIMISEGRPRKAIARVVLTVEGPVP